MLHPPGSYKIVEGSTVNIMCTIKEANPNSDIKWQWLINDTNIDNDGPNYTVSYIQRDKSGTYSCKASNSVGTSVAASTIVDVQCKYFQYSSWPLVFLKMADGTNVKNEIQNHKNV